MSFGEDVWIGTIDQQGRVEKGLKKKEPPPLPPTIGIDEEQGPALGRTEGFDGTASFWLANPWAEFRFDPNGYYKLLGLSTDYPWMMSDIHQAYRVMLKRTHPDVASKEHDPEMLRELLEDVQIAYEVLSDPTTRREYDALPEGESWIDRKMQEQKMREIRRGAVAQGEDPQEAVERKMGEIQGDGPKEGGVRRSNTGSIPEIPDEWTRDRFIQRPNRGALSVYFYEDDPLIFVPPQHETWVQFFAEWLWCFRAFVPVRVGYSVMSGRGFSLELMPWGPVFFVPFVADPEPFMPFNLVVAFLRMSDPSSMLPRGLEDG